MKDPRVALVILTHDRRETVCRTLAETLALPEAPAVVLVDNGSSDGTADAVAARFPAVHVVRLARNIGAAARNAGVWRARAPYVALSDDDTTWRPGSLARAADHLDAHPRLAIVTGRVLVGAAGREDPTCTEMAASPLAADDLPGPAVLGFLAGASMVRRAAFLGAGGFDPAFFIGGEERLLAVDLASAGWAIAYAPDVLVHHDPCAQRDAVARRRLLVRNAIWVAWLRRPARSALRETCRIVRAAGADAAVVRGVLEALRGVAWVFRRRRVVPAGVEAALRLIEAGGSEPRRVDEVRRHGAGRRPARGDDDQRPVGHQARRPERRPEAGEERIPAPRPRQGDRRQSPHE